MITIPLTALPAAISTSIAAVLESHGYAVVRRADTQWAIDEERLAELIEECGRNAAQVIATMEIEP